MRKAVAIDDELLLAARRLTGIDGTSGLVRRALQTLVERESARRLAALGGSDPELLGVRRR